MSEVAVQTIARQYLPKRHWGAVEAKILRQSPGLAAPILAADELVGQTFASGLLAMSAAIGNLTHQLALDRPVYWCVTRAEVVNAMIAGYRTPDMYCVVIGVGAINALSRFTLALAASEPLVEFLADGTDPVDNMQPPDRSRRDAWRYLAGGAEETMTPATVERAFPLLFLACYFLMAHEAGHLSGGHLALFAGDFAVEAGGMGHPDKQESRALERDADALAGAATVYLLGNPEFEKGWETILKDREAGLRHFFAASYILFSIMDLLGPEDALGQDRTHPPAMVRVSTMAVMLSLSLGQYGAFTAEEIWELGRRSVRAVELAALELGGGIMAPKEAAALQAVVDRNLAEHMEVWAGLQARLDRTHLDKYYWAQPLK